MKNRYLPLFPSTYQWVVQHGYKYFYMKAATRVRTGTDAEGVIAFVVVPLKSMDDMDTSGKWVEEIDSEEVHSLVADNSGVPKYMELMSWHVDLHADEREDF